MLFQLNPSSSMIINRARLTSAAGETRDRVNDTNARRSSLVRLKTDCMLHIVLLKSMLHNTSYLYQWVHIFHYSPPGDSATRRPPRQAHNSHEIWRADRLRCTDCTEAVGPDSCQRRDNYSVGRPPGGLRCPEGRFCAGRHFAATLFHGG